MAASIGPPLARRRDYLTFNRLVVNRAGDVVVASSSGVWRYTSLAQDILINGGFEADSGWDIPQTPWPAGYSDRVVYAGRRSVRIGVDSGNVVTAAYSSARQAVTIPADAISATLSFYVYPISGESAAAAPSRVLGQEMDASMSSPLGMSAGDAQYALIIPQTGSTLIPRTLFWGLSNAQAWQPFTFDLTAYAGQTFLLHLGVYNDGAGGQTGMYVDSASLVFKRAGARAHPLYLPLVVKD